MMAEVIHMSIADMSRTEVDSYKLEAEVDRMMAAAADNNLDHPWEAVKAARARLVFEGAGDIGDDVDWLSAVHRELTVMGYDPDDRSIC